MAVRWDLDPDYEERARDRFHPKYSIDENDCWIWNAALNQKGRYGTFNYRGRCRYAHQAAYIMFKGNVPDGLEIDHVCQNTYCVNPDHLEAVTHLENVRRSKVTKLDHEKVAAIRAELGPILERMIAKYGVSDWTLVNVATGRKSWRAA